MDLINTQVYENLLQASTELNVVDEFMIDKIVNTTKKYLAFISSALRDMHEENYKEKSKELISKIVNNDAVLVIFENVYNEKLMTKNHGFSNKSILEKSIYVLWAMQHPDFEKYNKDVLFNTAIFDYYDGYNKQSAIEIKNIQKQLIDKFLQNQEIEYLVR